jgi:hypothetical protein
LPNQSSQSDYPEERIGSPDLSFYYSPTQLYEMAEVYGVDGRSQYIRTRFTFDIFWPIIYGFFLITTISWIFSRVFNSESLFQYANLLPIFGVLFDYLENLSTSLVMYRYPARSFGIDVLASLFTTTKWIFISGAFIILGFELIYWGIKYFRRSLLGINNIN